LSLRDKVVLGICAVFRMKVIAAYLLAVLGGNTSPTADDVKNILESGISAILVTGCNNCCFFRFKFGHNFLLSVI
jgi:hypothetical protein